MKYRVTLDAYALGQVRYGPIPGTTQVTELDPHADGSPGHMVWAGYLEMYAAQRGQPARPGDWTRVTLPADAPEIERFREAMNLFHRFMAGEGRDNWMVVTKIEPLS